MFGLGVKTKSFIQKHRKMKVKIILLDYLRHDFTEQVKKHNFNNAGHPFDHVTIDMEGIAAAINCGIIQSLHYDAIVTMANDILMPDDWLKKMVEAAERIPETGMCTIHCVENLPEAQEINGVKVHPSWGVFGNALFPMKAIKKAGLFNIDYDPYGMQDSDYCFRLHRLGFLNYYLHGLKAEHIGSDAHLTERSEYRKMKDEGLNLCAEKWAKWTKQYEESGNFTINFKEWPNTNT